MATSWERIRQHLEAEVRGEEERPTVSRESLFGISSAVTEQLAAQGEHATQGVGVPSAPPAWGASTMTPERAAEIRARGEELSRQADELFDRFLSVVTSERGGANLREVARFMATYLDSRAVVGDADQYIFFVARRNGYDIPAYPLSQSGEVRKFLADEGVEDIPAWYAKQGFGRECYRTLSLHTMVAVRDRDFVWHPFLVKGENHVQGGRFVPLAGSHLVERGSAESLVQLMEGIIERLQPGE
jgi:hypothetical protein